MINKIAEAIGMAFEISDDEEKVARNLLKILNELLSALDHAKEYLNNMYDPFKKGQDIPEDQLQENRGAIHRFRKEVKNKYQTIKTELTFPAVTMLKEFETDIEVQEIIGSFKDDAKELEGQVEILLELLQNLGTPSFKDSVVKAIEEVRNKSMNMETLIKDRLIEFISENILGLDWVKETEELLGKKIDERVPDITQLFEERKKAAWRKL